MAFPQPGRGADSVDVLGGFAGLDAGQGAGGQGMGAGGELFVEFAEFE
ncbi:hypothetical protein [Enemella evansiae]|nr:hypothetical protein [Enemella evansiae]